MEDSGLKPPVGPHASNAIAVFVEGLPTSLVGAYGANTARTPAMDRLAARGLVVEHCFVDSMSFDGQLESLWTGRHALQAGQAAEQGWSLWKHLNSVGTSACLITDSPQVAGRAEQFGCPDVVLVEPTLNSMICEDDAECGLSAVFAAAAEELGAGRDGLVWVHSRGLRLPWDAPADLRRSFADPDDPQPPMEIGPPHLVVDEQSNPDTVTGWGQVAAAQASLLDHALAGMENAIRGRTQSSSFSWLLGSLGGVSLGENNAVGFDNPRSYPHSEHLRSVAILQPANWQSVGERRAELFQLPDLCITLLDLLGSELPRDAGCWGRSCLDLNPQFTPEHWPRSHQMAAICTDDWQWLRCPGWSAVLNAGQVVQLFVKPDDRWEVTNVVDRRADIAGRMSACLIDFVNAARDNRRGDWPELSEELTSLLR